jgi:glycosyltransferase involved in cell wall biosynthesis
MSELHTVDDRLRICVISFMFRPLVGGAEAQAEKHARELQALGHSVFVVTLRHDKRWKRREMLDGLPVVRVGGLYRRNGTLYTGRLRRPPSDLAMLLTLWRLRHRYDVIHVMQLSSISAIATFICKLMRKPIIISIQSVGPDEQQLARIEQHGAMLMGTSADDADSLKVKTKDWTPGDIESLPQSTLGGQAIVNFLRRSHAFYQVLSTRSRAYLTAHGFRPEQMVHIPNGVDTEQFRPAAQRPDPAQPAREIICVARLEYPKGVDVLLHAWARMMQPPGDWRAHLQPRLRIVGEGIFGPQMEHIAAELGIQNSVEFLGLRRDVVQLLQQAWGFVMPSRWEGMPNALVEAMACGLPCVATRVSGSEDIIIDGVNGLLVEPEQPDKMALALRRLIEDSSLAQRMAQEARATIVRDYQIRSVVERCLHVYYRLLSRGKPVVPLTLEGQRRSE